MDFTKAWKALLRWFHIRCVNSNHKLSHLMASNDGNSSVDLEKAIRLQAGQMTYKFERLGSSYFSLDCRTCKELYLKMECLPHLEDFKCMLRWVNPWLIFLCCHRQRLQDLYPLDRFLHFVWRSYIRAGEGEIFFYSLCWWGERKWGVPGLDSAYSQYLQILVQRNKEDIRENPGRASQLFSGWAFYQTSMGKSRYVRHVYWFTNLRPVKKKMRYNLFRKRASFLLKNLTWITN